MPIRARSVSLNCGIASSFSTDTPKMMPRTMVQTNIWNRWTLMPLSSDTPSSDSDDESNFETVKGSVDLFEVRSKTGNATMEETETLLRALDELIEQDPNGRHAFNYKVMRKTVSDLVRDSPYGRGYSYGVRMADMDRSFGSYDHASTDSRLNDSFSLMTQAARYPIGSRKYGEFVAGYEAAYRASR